ncbi:hypothetical protein DL95DRAFT_397471, partial [Leptodontidium sp. 2 PMI_412]
MSVIDITRYIDRQRGSLLPMLWRLGISVVRIFIGGCLHFLGFDGCRLGAIIIEDRFMISRSSVDREVVAHV